MAFNSSVPSLEKLRRDEWASLSWPFRSSSTMWAYSLMDTPRRGGLSARSIESPLRENRHKQLIQNIQSWIHLTVHVVESPDLLRAFLEVWKKRKASSRPFCFVVPLCWLYVLECLLRLWQVSLWGKIQNVRWGGVGGSPINAVIGATFARCREGVLLSADKEIGGRSGHEGGRRWSSHKNVRVT